MDSSTFAKASLDTASQTFTYSPLGWGIWLYGPMLVLGGIFIIGLIVTSLQHGMANSGPASGPHNFGDVINLITHFGCISRCFTTDYLFGGFFIFGLPLFASLLIFFGLLMMNSDRTTIVSQNSVSISRGSFIHWGRQTFTKSDIASITTDSVMATMVFGNRSTSAGTRYNVGVVTAPTSSKKSHRIIIGLFPSESSAKESVKQIETLIK